MDPITAILLNIVIGAALSAVTTLAEQAFAPKPTTPKVQVRGYRGAVTTGGTNPQTIVLGTYGVAGHLDYRNTWGNSGETPNAYLVDVISLSDLPVTAATAAWVNAHSVSIPPTGHTSKGYPISLTGDGGTDHLWREFYDGTQSSVSSYLNAKFGADATRPWGTDAVGEGIAYATMTARVNDKLWSGWPVYMFQLQGAPLYDPRKDTTAGGSGSHRWGTPATYEFSDNNVVLIYNIMRGIYDADGNHIWGGHATAYQMPYAVWSAAMDACDESVSLKAGGSEKRYRAGIEIGVDERPADIVQELLIGCNGRIAYAAGQYFILIGVPGSADGSFTDDDLLIDQDATFDLWPNIDNVVNGATATYVAPGKAWESKETAPYYRSDLEEEDDDRRLLRGLTLRTVFSATQAQRLLKTTVEESRRFRRFVLPLKPEFGRYRPLQVLAWTSDRNQFDAKLFLITTKTEDPWGNVILGLQEIDPADDSWTPSSDETTPTFAPLTPIVPASQAATGVTAIPAYMEDEDGNQWLPSIEVGWAANLDDVASVLIQAREGWGSNRLIFEGSVAYDLSDPSPSKVLNASFVGNADYEGRVRYLPISDRETDWSSWIGVTTPQVAPVPQGSITNEELARRWRDGIEFIVGNGPALLEQRIMDALDRLGGSVTTNTMASDRDRRAISSVVGTVQAAVVQEAATRASADTALSTFITEVAAQAASGLAEGLFTVRAEAAPDGVSVRLALLARVTTLDDYVETGILIDLLPDGGGGYTSQILFKADSIYFTDGDVKTLPMVFSAGVLTLNVSNIGTVIAGIVQNAAGTSYFNLNTGALRVST